MTNEEAEALDELWTNTTPEIDTSKPGFLARKSFTMISLDPVTAIYLQAKSAVSHHSPSEIISERNISIFFLPQLFCIKRYNYQQAYGGNLDFRGRQGTYMDFVLNYQYAFLMPL